MLLFEACLKLKKAGFPQDIYHGDRYYDIALSSGNPEIYYSATNRVRR